MKMRIGMHPSQAARLDTQELRREYLVENVFRPDVCTLTATEAERFVFGGIMPVSGPLGLPEAFAEAVDAAFPLERRELALINVGGEGMAEIGGERYVLGPEDALYVGRGTADLSFRSVDAARPAKLFFASVPADTRHPTRRLPEAEARSVVRGDRSSAGRRRIVTYIAPDLLPTCRLVMGVTKLVDGTLWNTMPPHHHPRRSEIYLYYAMEADTYVVHLMGRPEETRHLVVRDEQAVIVPSWSIHSGVGTGPYAVAWIMAGENQTISDFEIVPPDVLA